jgi:hypothetical protein
MVAVDGRYRREPILLNLVPHTITPAISSVFATVPALVAAASERAGMRFLEFFAANIRNPHTRRAYARAAEEFLGSCASVGAPSINSRTAGPTSVPSYDGHMEPIGCFPRSRPASSSAWYDSS